MDVRARSKKHEFLAAFVSLLVLSSLYAAPLLPASAAVPGLHIELSADQRLSISGHSPSLAATLEELSWRAGFQLRGFDAEDRPLSVQSRDRDDPARNSLGPLSTSQWIALAVLAAYSTWRMLTRARRVGALG